MKKFTRANFIAWLKQMPKGHYFYMMNGNYCAGSLFVRYITGNPHAKVIVCAGYYPKNGSPYHFDTPKWFQRIFLDLDATITREELLKYLKASL